ncbi:M28 family peptidase [Psychroserpens burtonensis]|uniref:M28 family peptidase n=1 Tax=Psychroserpens burtonensis TaxID=49278 RepID=A0A5C7BA02_9FLAO|nr:M28 family peptidase [Psychroserpens burtonensis]TXE17517.1 M28 family peptidase [Psychroserpens burtonensis]
MKKRLLLLTLASVFTVTAQTEIEKVKETISKSDIEGHIYFLADDVLKGRATGSPELKIAASYLANTFRRYGVKPNPKTGTYYQAVTLKSVSPPKHVSIEINSQVITDYAFLNAAAVTSNQDAIFLNYGLADDYMGKDVKGKVIIVKAGSPETSDTRAVFELRGSKEKLAKDNGVMAIIELLKTDDKMWGFIDHNFNEPSLTVDLGEDDKSDGSDIAYVWVLDREGKMAEQLSAVTTISSKIAIGDKQEEAVISQNVIGVVEGTDETLKNEYIIYSAHYDHVGIGEPDETGDTIYNGARDNAVGTTTVLSMAENLAKYPTKRSALFILFTGEEKGLLGSSYYVENPVLPLNQMVYCFNSDNAGYNDTSLISIIGLTRTTAENNIFSAAETFGLKAIEDPAKEQGLFDRSDNVNFAKKGIPAPTFSLGFTSFDGDVTKYYHRPGDEAHTLDYDYLLKFFKSYVLAGRKIANDPVTPVWNSGDKYEKASKGLYDVKAIKN